MRTLHATILAAAVLLSCIGGCASSGPENAGLDEATAEKLAAEAAAAAAAEATAEAIEIVAEAYRLDAEGDVGAAFALLNAWQGPPRARSHCLEAAAEISMAHGQPTLAVLSLEQAAKMRPGDPGLILKKGEAFLAAGRENAAEASLRECLALDWRRDRAKVLLGEILFENGRVDEAAAFLDAVDRDYPFDARSLVLLGAIRHGQGDSDEALRLFTRAALSDPSLPEPYFNRGCVFEGTGNRDLAEQAYSEALRRDSKHVPSLFNLGRLLFETGRVAEGERYLEAACSLANDPADRKSMERTTQRLLESR